MLLAMTHNPAIKLVGVAEPKVLTDRRERQYEWRLWPQNFFKAESRHTTIMNEVWHVFLQSRPALTEPQGSVMGTNCPGKRVSGYKVKDGYNVVVMQVIDQRKEESSGP